MMKQKSQKKKKEEKKISEKLSYFKNEVLNKWLDLQVRIDKAIEYMNNYIELEDKPINERIKIEFKEVKNILTGGDE